MNIKILGTAAAEGWPALFCDCPYCVKARQLGGKNIRTRSSCLIEKKYMVDFPPDTYMHVLTNQINLSDVEYLIVTHSHEDHFYPEDIHLRKEPYAHIPSENKLNLYGNDAVKRKFDYTNVEEDKKQRVIFKQLSPFQQYLIGDAEVTPLLADHIPEETCLIYLIKLQGKTLLYGNDSGYFPESTWKFIGNTHIDAAILDCTDGPGGSFHYHMGFAAVLKVKQRLLEQRCADSETAFVITHFSHNGRYLHKELEKMALPYDFIVAFDGMELRL
jgi:phosphoribosyl 1,2-cyclic phosphate phosphodiesterase